MESEGMRNGSNTNERSSSTTRGDRKRSCARSPTVPRLGRQQSGPRPAARAGGRAPAGPAVRRPGPTTRPREHRDRQQHTALKSSRSASSSRSQPHRRSAPATRRTAPSSAPHRARSAGRRRSRAVGRSSQSSTIHTSVTGSASQGQKNDERHQRLVTWGTLRSSALVLAGLPAETARNASCGNLDMSQLLHAFFLPSFCFFSSSLRLRVHVTTIAFRQHVSCAAP